MLKYEEGNHYADHSDFFEMWGTRTDYTVVVNLNDDYEGGEHFIKIGSERIERKLEPGKALVYPTEFLHGVNPITKGIRKCLTFWMESSIVDPTMRYYLVELNKLYHKIEGSMEREDLVNFDLIRMGMIKRNSIFRN
jgi:PKHD-type hydroxylase